MAVFSFLHPGRCTYVYMLRAHLYCDTCTALHPPVYMYIHIRDQNDYATYASTRWVPTVRHFLACEDVAGGSQQSGGRIVLVFFARTHFLACEDVAGGSQQSGRQIVFFARTHFLACEGVAGGSQQSGGKRFFAKYGGPSGGSLLSGGGIIIFRVIRRHFLAAAVDPAVSLSTYNPRPIEVVP